MKLKDVGNVKVYDLSVGKTLPQWLSERQRRSLAKDADFRRRLELVQDFHFTTASRRIKMCRDNQHIVVTGTYPPVVKVFDVKQLSLKFDRHLDTDVVQFETLSDDYSKLVFLGVDRTLTFHAAYGTYYSTRIPRMGRDMLYHQGNCDLYVCASSREVYRLNLEQGTFLEPFKTNLPSVNTMALSSVHQLLAFGGDNGVLESWDPRTKDALSSLDIGDIVHRWTGVASGPESGFQPQQQVTSVEFNRENGLELAVGTHSGHCLLFDLRSSRPLQVKEHQYNLPILSVKFQQGGDNIVSVDPKVVKVWNKKTAKVFANVESEHPINDLWIVEGPRSMSSGLMLVASEQDRIKSFYIPQFGPAPTWASFLDNLTEELEENEQSSMYDDYKFVTRQDLEKLGVGHLVGTPLLKAYMHGYFMDMRLYNHVKSISEPFAFEEWRKSKVREKLEKKRENRIKIKSSLPAVNRATAERLTKPVSDEQAKKKKKSKSAKAGETLMKDSRFADLFQDPDFEIDEDSEQFKLVHPSGIAGTTNAGDMDSDVEVSSEEESDRDDAVGEDTDGSNEQYSSDNEKAIVTKVRKREKPLTTQKRKLVSIKSGSAEPNDLFAAVANTSRRNIVKKDKTHSGKKTLGQRVEEIRSTPSDIISHRKLAEGNFEFSFVPEEKKKKKKSKSNSTFRTSKR